MVVLLAGTVGWHACGLGRATGTAPEPPTSLDLLTGTGAVDAFRADQLPGIVGPAAPPLALRQGPPVNVTHEGAHLRQVPTNFSTVNWAGAEPGVFWIHGTLVYPENATGALGRVPAVVVMHGLNNLMTADLIALARSFAARGFVALTYSQPGHGASEGARPTSANFGTAGWNRTEHFYLLVACALRAVTLLEALPEVDPTQILLTGSSYGGLTTMVVSAVYHDHVLGGIPVVATGAYKESLTAEGKLLSWIFGNWEGDLAPQWDVVGPRIDPLAYVTDARCPPLLFLLGTTDEFFSATSARLTLEGVGPRGAVLFNPNGHHGFGLDPAGFPTMIEWGTIDYWLAHVLNGSVAPPVITTDAAPAVRWRGVTVDVTATIARAGGTSVAGDLPTVDLFYRLVDVPGEPWRPARMIPVASSGNATWRAAVPSCSTWYSSRVEYFVQVTWPGTRAATGTGTRAGTGVVRFSSNLVQDARVVGHLHVGLLVGLLVLLVIPVWLLFRRRWCQLDDYLRVEAPGGHPTAWLANDNDAARALLLEEALVVLGETLVLVGFTRAYVQFGTGAGWTGTFLADDYLSLFGSNLGLVILGILYLAFLAALARPVFASGVNIAFPVFIVMLYLQFVPAFGPPGFAPVTLAAGFWLHLAGASLQFVAGRYRRHVRLRATRVSPSSLDRPGPGPGLPAGKEL